MFYFIFDTQRSHFYTTSEAINFVSVLVFRILSSILCNKRFSYKASDTNSTSQAAKRITQSRTINYNKNSFASE
jgi:hypothetical protein